MFFPVTRQTSHAVLIMQLRWTLIQVTLSTSNMKVKQDSEDTAENIEPPVEVVTIFFFWYGKILGA